MKILLVNPPIFRINERGMTLHHSLELGLRM